jgi:hypothetical protein
LVLQCVSWQRGDDGSGGLLAAIRHDRSEDVERALPGRQV